MATREEWIGRVGLEWARRGSATETLLGPAGEAGLDALAPAPGMHLLDLGCGGGASTALLAERVGPGGHVTAIDISPDLVARAREQLADHPNVTVIEADAETHPFEAEQFDGLYSRFGSMFFDDPPAAFANLHRALRPGAPVVLVAWREIDRNQWASVPMTFVTESIAGAGPHAGPPASKAGPFAWADRRTFLPLLEAAGFHDVKADTFEFMAAIGDGDDPDPVRRATDFMMRIGPLAARLRGASDEQRAEARAFLMHRLARHARDDAVRLLATVWIIRARA